MTSLRIWRLGLVLFVMLSVARGMAAPVARASQEIRVLIVTGMEHPAHDWKKTSVALREELEKDPRIRVEILGDPYQLESANLEKFKAVLLNFNNWEKPDPSDRAKTNLQNFVTAGGGLTVVHFACGAFPNWPDYASLAGKVWDRTNTHDPRGPFRVEFKKVDHPITRGLAAFDTDDELYFCLAGSRPVQVLALAHSKVKGTDQPMAFVHQFGKGRVFHTPLGHDARAIHIFGTAEMIRRGTAWAAGYEPAPSTNGAALTPNAREIEATFKLPDGFQVRLIAAEPDLANPISMTLSESGTIYVSEAHTYRWGRDGSPFQPPSNPIKKIELGADGRAIRVQTVAENFPEPVMGLAARGAKVFATCLNELVVFDSAPDGQLVHRRTLVKDAAAPWNPFGMYRVEIGPDGKIWFSVGDHPSSVPVTLTGSDGTQLRLHGQSGGLLRCEMDGSGLELIAQGFRAPFAFEIDPWGHIWQISNGEGSPNVLADIIPGLDYGYASRRVSYDWLAGRERLSPPVFEMPAGANTSVLHYYSSMFPAEFGANMLISNWGSHGDGSKNRAVYRYAAAANGELLKPGAFLECSDPHFRPTQIALAPDGGLYVLDWHGRDDENDRTGRILKIICTHAPQARPTGLQNSEGRSLAAALAHPNHFVRKSARRSVDLDNPAIKRDLTEIAERGTPLAAAEAIWALRGDTAGLLRGLHHPDSRVRAHALRQLRDAAGQTLAGLPNKTRASGEISISRRNLAAATVPLISDPSAEVSVEAALAQETPQAITDSLISALDRPLDRRLAYQIGFALARFGNAEAMVRLWNSTNGPSRLGAEVALDISRADQLPLFAGVQEKFPSALEELAPAGFAEKLDWLSRKDPAAFAAEMTRLDQTANRVLSRDERLAVLTILGRTHVDALPTRIVSECLVDREPAIQEKALQVCFLAGSKVQQSLAPVLLRLARMDKTRSVKVGAIFVLGNLSNGVDDSDWLGWIEHSSPEISLAALRALRAAERPAALKGKVVESSLNWACARPELAEDIRLTLQSFAIRDSELLASLSNSPADKSNLAELILRGVPAGSPLLGQWAFMGSRLQCSKCHSAETDAKSFGPNLAGIGSTAQPAYLVESILFPSHVLKTGFQPETISATKDRLWTGFVESKGRDLLVQTGPGESVSVTAAEVLARVPSTVSLMPEDMEKAMSPAEVADLVRFLLTLKTTQH